jgi:uncharacterized protein YcbX
MSQLTISELIIYPVKSARGCSLKSMQLNPMGPECDRRWMVIDKNNAFVTQRKVRKMCLINVDQQANGIRLSVEGMSACTVEQPISADLLTSSVWGAEVKGFDCGDEVAAWLTEFLSKDCRLIYMPDDYKRVVDTDFAHQQEQVGFADGFPLLIATQASLDDFSDKLGYKVGMERFRPNIVISGNNSYAEDEWQTIAIGDIELSLVKPCARCIMPSVNPATAAKETAVNQTLQMHRRRGSDTFFGQNALYNRLGTIHFGDHVRIIK